MLNNSLGNNTLGNTTLLEGAELILVDSLGIISEIKETNYEYDYSVFTDALSLVSDLNDVQFLFDYTAFPDVIGIHSNLTDIGFQGIIIEANVDSLMSVSDLLEPDVGFFFTVWLDAISAETQQLPAFISYDYGVSVDSLGAYSDVKDLDFSISTSKVLDVLHISSDSPEVNLEYDYTLVLEKVGSIEVSQQELDDVEAEFNVFPWKPDGSIKDVKLSGNIKNIKPRLQ